MNRTSTLQSLCQRLICAYKFVYAHTSLWQSDSHILVLYLSTLLYLYLCAEILLFQLHSFFIRYIEVPSAEKFASFSRECLRVNAVPAEGFCHAAMKIKFVRCIMGKYIKPVEQGKKGDLPVFLSHPKATGPMFEHVT